MSHTTTRIEAVAHVASALLTEHHVADVLGQLVADCATVLPADVVAIMVVNGSIANDLVSSSSHQDTALRMLAAQLENGPCTDATDTGEVVSATGSADIIARWGDAGEAIAAAGFGAVTAFPLCWRGRNLGALSVFHTEDGQRQGDYGLTGQAFADLATLVLVHSNDIPVDQITARVHEAVAARSVVEQAKGVLAYVHRVDMNDAYGLLADRAGQDGHSITDAALGVVREQQRER